MPDNLNDWMDWTTGVTGADAPAPILTHDEIEAIVDSVVGNLGNFHTEPGTMPAGATMRPRGAFSDPHDLQSYLEGGGLLTYDDMGNPVPNPIVNVLKTQLCDDCDIIYEVWIDDNS